MSVAGASAYALSPWIGLAVAVVLLTVVTSYRQNVHAYPSGGGDYEVATTNLGRRAGLDRGQRAARRLHADGRGVDLGGGGQHRVALVPLVAEHKVSFAVGAIVLLTAANLRGIRESGTAFAIPVYAFMIGIGAMIVWGLVRILLLGQPVLAASADLTLLAEGDAFTGLALVFLILRSFTRAPRRSPASRRSATACPRSASPSRRNAATTLLLLGLLAVTMFMGLIALAAADRRPDRGGSRDAVRRRAGRLRPADDGGPARRRRVLVVPAGLLLRRRGDGADPGARRQHGVQRLPGARLDPRPGPLPAAAAAHPRRSARVLQRHPLPRRVRGDRVVVGFQAEVTGSSSSTSSVCSCRSRCRRSAWCGTGTGCCAPRPTRTARRRMRRSRSINGFGAI